MDSGVSQSRKKAPPVDILTSPVSSIAPFAIMSYFELSIASGFSGSIALGLVLSETEVSESLSST